MSKKLITFPCAGGSANNFNKIIKNLDCKIYIKNSPDSRFHCVSPYITLDIPLLHSI